jgi:hypothetical protein
LSQTDPAALISRDRLQAAAAISLAIRVSTRTADVVRDSEAEIARLNSVIEGMPAKLERERKAWRDDAVDAAILEMPDFAEAVLKSDRSRFVD